MAAASGLEEDGPRRVEPQARPGAWTERGGARDNPIEFRQVEAARAAHDNPSEPTRDEAVAAWAVDGTAQPEENGSLRAWREHRARRRRMMPSR